MTTEPPALYTLDEPLRVVWCGNHGATRYPNGCQHRNTTHPLDEPVRIHHRDHPERGDGYRMWTAVGAEGQSRITDVDGMLELWAQLVSAHDLPHRKVSEAFAVVAEWRELRIRGYRAFIPGHYDRMNPHNP